MKGVVGQVRKHDVSICSGHKESFVRNYWEESSLRNSLACNTTPLKLTLMYLFQFKGQSEIMHFQEL